MTNTSPSSSGSFGTWGSSWNARTTCTRDSPAITNPATENTDDDYNPWHPSRGKAKDKEIKARFSFGALGEDKTPNETATPEESETDDYDDWFDLSFKSGKDKEKEKPHSPEAISEEADASKGKTEDTKEGGNDDWMDWGCTSKKYKKQNGDLPRTKLIKPGASSKTEETREDDWWGFTLKKDKKKQVDLPETKSEKDAPKEWTRETQEDGWWEITTTKRKKKKKQDNGYSSDGTYSSSNNPWNWLDMTPTSIRTAFGLSKIAEEEPKNLYNW
jgi:hypothetical protein